MGGVASAGVGVTERGQTVERGAGEQVFAARRDPCTRRLSDAVPVPDPMHQRPPAPRLGGEVPSPVHPVGQGPKRVKLTDVGCGHLVAPAAA